MRDRAFETLQALILICGSPKVTSLIDKLYQVTSRRSGLIQGLKSCTPYLNTLSKATMILRDEGKRRNREWTRLSMSAGKQPSKGVIPDQKHFIFRDWRYETRGHGRLHIGISTSKFVIKVRHLSLHGVEEHMTKRLTDI